MLAKCFRRADIGCEVECLAIESEQGAELGVADAGRILQDRAKHRFELTRGVGDDLKHVGRRSLLLQSFAELS